MFFRKPTFYNTLFIHISEMEKSLSYSKNVKEILEKKTIGISSKGKKEKKDKATMELVERMSK